VDDEPNRDHDLPGQRRSAGRNPAPGMMNDSDPFADGATIIKCYGGAKPTDRHLASKIVCIDDEIIGWLKRRERHRRERESKEFEHTIKAFLSPKNSPS
jgi:hypothetical protein